MSPLRLLNLALLLTRSLSIYALPFPADRAVGTVWTFDNETWIENFAIRKSGSILCTSLNRAALYLVDPFAHTAVTVHQFAQTDRPLGISEIEADIFAVVSNNVTMETSEPFRESSKIWRVDMEAWELGIPDPVSLVANLSRVGLPDGMTTLKGSPRGRVLLADSSRGIIWQVNTNDGSYSVAIQSDAFNPTNPQIPLGVDGIHVLDGYLYFTNLGNGTLARLPINSHGIATGPIEPWANVLGPDDFALTADGTAYVVGFNTLYRVVPNGTVATLAGGPNDMTLEGATSAQLGRTHRDRDVLYIGTSGGMLAPVNGKIHGGQILAINVELFK